MNPKISRLLFFFLLTFHLNGYSQGIGLVLSGGGASGFAHIGVIKALEENNIPINYITGTSSGALVGAMYACGYSASEIETYVLSNEFQMMAAGKVGREREFFLREDDISSSILEFSFSGDSIIKKSLPTNFVRPALLDYEMMRIMGHPDAATGHDFDKLFVPFRCVASDIVAKKSMVFKDGYLNEAVRASMTFPFFVNPIRINGVLYFDGGLYNNFPADVMYRNFSPDFIIGSNVSYNAGLPTEDDVISQIENMLVSYSNFSLPCEDGILISPQTSVTTFEFSDVKTAIDDGYRATIEKMDSIKAAIPDRISTEELTERRRQFKSKIPALRISDVNTKNSKGLDQSYVRRSIFKKSKDEVMSETRLERRYFRTYATPQLQYLFPKLDMRPDSTFRMDVNVKKAKPFRVDIGGIVSSRAINTGFAQLNYFNLGKVGTTAKANVYFGKFYSSGKGQIDINLPSYYPVSFSVYATHNNFDYFRSFATFSVVDRPSFLVQTEDYFGGQFKQPIFNNSKSTLDFRKVWLRDRYYQTEDFTNIDTADVTRFAGNVFSWTIEQNSLNRKQYASEGTYLMFRGRFIDGFENSMSGSTAVEKYDIRKYHSWLSFSGEVRTFPFPFKHFKLGIHALANITTQPLFRNYTATLLSMPAFQPIPDMQTYFFPEYRSPQYFGAGLNVIFTFWKNFDLRFDGYIYQPFIQVITNEEDNTFGYSKPFKGDAQVAAISGIYHSPIGPVRASINYFPMQKNPINFQFTYGYILFNERAIR